MAAVVCGVRRSLEQKDGGEESFRKVNPIEKRQAKASRMRNTLPGQNSGDHQEGCKERHPEQYLAPADMMVGQIVFVSHDRFKLDAKKAIFIVVQDVLPPFAAMMSVIYDEHQHADGFVYLTCCGEDTVADWTLPYECASPCPGRILD